jgi:glycosyltransferase involved in cell wall biosynthesis
VKVSLCLTTYNDAEKIPAFMAAINQQTRPPDEMIVVDGGSTDETPRLFSKWVRVVVNDTCNIAHCASPVARGRNHAIRLATGEVIVVTNVDCVPDRFWIERLVDPFTHWAQVVGGMVESGAQTKFERLSAKIILPAAEGLAYDPSSRNIAFRKGMWKDIGGYPELTLTAEDTFFNHKLREWGVKFYFVPDAIVTWRPRPNMRDLLKQVYRYSKGDAICGLNRGMHLRKLLKFCGGFGFVFLLIWLAS